MLALFAILLGTVLAAPTSAGAGGWVVVSLDSMPSLVAGERVDVGFTVLRHGVAPESSGDLLVTLTDDSGRRFEFEAVPAGAVGHHVVTIEVPAAGDYTWTIFGEFVPVELGTLAIGADPAAEQATWRWDALQWGSASLALAMAGLAGWDVLRSRRLAARAIAA